jgi:hypothetical protein
MKKLRIVTAVALLLAFLASAWIPAPAYAATSTTITLSISNKTGMAVTINLTGPKNYTIPTVPGNTQKEISSGVYRYSYKACGVEKKGELKAKGKKAKINIPACKTSNIRIVNQTDQTLQVSLTGPFTYRFTIPPESSLPAKVIRGVYRGTGVQCGENFSREVQALIGRYVWVFFPCE